MSPQLKGMTSKRSFSEIQEASSKKKGDFQITGPWNSAKIRPCSQRIVLSLEQSVRFGGDVVTHRSPLGPLLLFLPMSMYGSSLSVSVQTNISPNGLNCSMLATTSASCSSSVGQVALATSSATASFGHLSGNTQSGGTIIYGPFVQFDTSFSEMLTITAANHAGTGTLISRFNLIVSANTDDSFASAYMRVGIHQSGASYDSGFISAASREQVVNSTFEFGVPFVFSAEMSQSWTGCCGDGEGSWGTLDLTGFTVLDGDGNILTYGMTDSGPPAALSTPEPSTMPVVAVGLLALVATLRKRLTSIG